MKNLAILLALFVAALQADEGMWTYNRLPLEQLESKHRFAPSEELLLRLQRASVRFNNGGSGAFVSPSGLVMTNHHIAQGCIQKVSSEQKDYIADGFYASTRARELKCPDLELNVLMEIETVTDQVNRGVTAESSDADRLEAQRSAIARIERDCRDSTLLRCDVVNLYQGGIFDLYKYKRYTDVRLVFAPQFEAAYFGGDPDNFTFPRYCLDAAFVRVYDKDRPLESPAYLPVDPSGAEEGELVLVSGHPGTTKRLLTEAQLRFERDRRSPFVLDFLTGMQRDLRAYGQGGGEAARLARDEVFRIDNAVKAYRGTLAGLRDREVFERKAAQEKQLREAVAGRPELAEQYGAAWEKIAQAQRVRREIYEEYSLLSSVGFYSKYFTFASQLYRLADELAKPNGERLDEYQSARLESLYQQLYSLAPVYPEIEIVKLASSLRFLRDRLSANHPLVRELLASRTPEVLAREVIGGSALADPEIRKKLGADESALAKSSDDPMIELVRSIDERYRKIRKRYEDEVEAVERGQGTRIAQARFAVSGADVYPDATFTLRLAFGRVKAYLDDDRTRVAAFTEIDGLFAKAGEEPPYRLPKSVMAARSRLDGKTPYNLVSTNDITGGNSGSPLIDAKGRVVGLIFDGNIYSLVNEYLYSERQGRAVSVDVRGILEMLAKTYRARRLVAELRAAGN